MKDQVIREYNDGSIIKVRVSPSSSRSAVEGIRDEQVMVSVRSIPEKGKANKEVLKVLAKALGVPPSSLEVMRGHASRNKTIIARTITASDALARLKSI